MEIIKYPDDTSYAVAKKLEQEYTQEGIPIHRNRSRFLNDLTIRVNTYEELWHLNQIVDSYNANSVIPTITLPWLIDGQADRRFANNQSFGLKLVCKFLNSMNANFKIFHPHNVEFVYAAMDNAEIIDNSEFIKQVLTKLSTKQAYNSKNQRIAYAIEKNDYVVDENKDLVVLLPDGGAYKWGAKLMDKLDFRGDVIAAAKNRKFVDGKSILTQQLPDYDFKGKDILIIDDICIYGGTFKGLAKMLRERNCGKLYLAVSHITVQNHDKDNVFSHFDNVFTTNSKYDVYYERIDGSSGKEIKNLEIIKLF